MTTQSPDQSLSQSQNMTPELEAIVLKWAYIGRTTDATREESILGAINEALALSQSPAPSKELEERIDEIVAREIAYESMQFWRDDLKKILTAFAAELGKEREAKTGELMETIAILHRQLSDKDVAFGGQTVMWENALKERDQLKRELAEAQKWKDLWNAAQDELASSDSDKNAYREAMEKAQSELAEARELLRRLEQSNYEHQEEGGMEK